MFVDYILPKWSSAYSLTSSLRVQQFLFELSPTCVCPNFSSMVQELQQQKAASANTGGTSSSEAGEDDGRPRHLIALALETTRARSFDGRLPGIGSKPVNKSFRSNQRSRRRARLISIRSSEDLTGVGKMNDIELLFLGPSQHQRQKGGGRLLSRYSLPSRKEFYEWKTSPRYRHLAENSVKLAMSCWTAGRHNIPEIRIHGDNTMDSGEQLHTGVPRSSSLVNLNASQHINTGSPKGRTRSDEGLQIPPASGITYSMAEFDELRASVYSGSESTKRSSISPTAMAAVVVRRDSVQKSAIVIETERRCRSYADLEQEKLLLNPPAVVHHAFSNPVISHTASDAMADLFETADVLGRALEMHLKQQAASSTV